MGKQSTHAPVPIRRGSGHGTYAWWFVVIGGDPPGTGVAASTALQAPVTAGVGQGSRAMKPGNAGGAKGPDFWHAFEDGEDKVIGDEPDNAR